MGMEKSFMLCAIPVNHTSSRHVSGQPGCQQAAQETEQELISCMAYQFRRQVGVSALLWPQAGSWRGRRESTPKREEPAARLLFKGKLQERGAIGEICGGMHCRHQGNDACAAEETLSLWWWDSECCRIKNSILAAITQVRWLTGQL